MAFTGLVLALSAPVAFADCPLSDPSCIVDQTKQTATDTANGPKDKADAAIKQATDAVGGILNPIGLPTPTPTPTGRGGGDHEGSGGSVPNGGPATTPTSSGVGALNRAAITGTATPAPSSSRPVRHGTAHGPSLFGRIGGAVAEAAGQVVFPLALALLVVAFLMAQNRLDRRDPKLAEAPIAPDILRFA
jgi:uncharacterized membrane protein YtjA (UPF0391 family)